MARRSVLDPPGERATFRAVPGDLDHDEALQQRGALTEGRRRCKGEGVGPACVIVPALDAAETVGAVVDDLRATLGLAVIVVDDGSVDATGDVARSHGAAVVRHEQNLGKGAAIRAGLREADKRGCRVALTVDADGQHPGRSARAVLEGSDDPRALVLGVRDLVRDGAPASNRFGNGVSNYFLSLFARRPLRDTQCGLRRYPVVETIDLSARAPGFAFEGEVVLRALAAGLPVVEVPIAVVYDAAGRRGSHFRRVLDPTRIVATVVRTVFELRLGGS
jgi:glycosyltransferase involved in cell wall biosynthesis